MAGNPTPQPANPYEQPTKAPRTTPPSLPGDSMKLSAADAAKLSKIMIAAESTPRATVAKGASKTSTLSGVSGVLGGQHAGGNSDVAKSKAAEAMLAKDIAAGKVKNLDAERQMILKKTGAWANGPTN